MTIPSLTTGWSHILCNSISENLHIVFSSIGFITSWITLTKREAAILNFSGPGIITSREVIMRGMTQSSTNQSAHISKLLLVRKSNTKSKWWGDLQWLQVTCLQNLSCISWEAPALTYLISVWFFPHRSHTVHERYCRPWSGKGCSTTCLRSEERCWYPSIWKRGIKTVMPGCSSEYYNSSWGIGKKSFVAGTTRRLFGRSKRHPNLPW